MLISDGNYFEASDPYIRSFKFQMQDKSNRMKSIGLDDNFYSFCNF